MSQQASLAPLQLPTLRKKMMRTHGFGPYNKIALKAAAKGKEAYLGVLDRVTLAPGQGLVCRLLPWVTGNEAVPYLRLWQHVWPPFGCQERVSTPCPNKISRELLGFDESEQPEPCEACKACVELSWTGVCYALVDDRRNAVALRFSEQNRAVLKALIEEDCFSFDRGRLVELRAGPNWALDYRLLEGYAVDGDQYESETEVLDVRVQPWLVRPDKLHHMASAMQAWRRLGKPSPHAGQSVGLRRQLPQSTLIHAPWGFKAPQSMAWQNSPFALMGDTEHLDGLDQGNVCLLCGRDVGAVKERAIEDLITLCLDPDDQDFAYEVERLNSTWLGDTFAVVGNRGTKYFYSVRGEDSAAQFCLKGSKIKRRCADGRHRLVGERLSGGQQGVIFGLHPAGKFYRPNDKPIVVIRSGDFRLPRNCYLTSAADELSEELANPHARRWKHQNGSGPILNEKLLRRVRRTENGTYAACPACQHEGYDSAGDNLLIYPDGRFVCARFINESGRDKHNHNQLIYRLTGQSKDRYDQ